jgi:Tol biopolymer transport system component
VAGHAEGWPLAGRASVADQHRANDFDPLFSADGRWLYFFSNRPGGRRRRPVPRAGAARRWFRQGRESRPRREQSAATNGADAKPRRRAAAVCSDGFGGPGRHDLFVARWDGRAFVDPRPLPGVNTRDDEFDAAWLGDGKAVVFTRSKDVETQPVRLYIAQCDGREYAAIAPLALSFNTDDAFTFGPALDWNKPAEMLVTGTAKAPRAGKLDIYRMKAPAASGRNGCI